MTQADPTTDRLLVGNCLDTLKTLADASIDSIVTDPPYELGFMGKAWDASGIAYQVQLWAECLRVLKPGGYLLAFGGTRTYHRMAVAIEDAGFEIRDSIHWTYGSGFPKSLNVAKSIQAKKTTGKASPKGQRLAAMGDEYQATPLAGTPGYGTTGNFQNKDTGSKPLAVTDPTAKQWDGWGTALKPSHEPIVVARKPLDGTVADNVQQYGTGAINIDATRVGTETITINGQGNDNMFHGNFSGEIDNPTRTGRFPANTLLTHNHDCQQTGTTQDGMTGGFGNGGIGMSGVGMDQGEGKDAEWQSKSITVATWSCTPNCPIELLDQQSGTRQAGAFPKNATVASGEHYDGGWKAVSNDERIDMGSGGASRFFHNSQWSQADDLTPFIYTAKPGKKERNAGLDHLEDKRQDEDDYERAGTTNPRNRSQLERKNFHPTVKPVQLIRYLIKMVTPPKGTVLDPFLGSGTTAVAAILEGVEWKGCELTEDYLPIIKGRTAWATKERKKQVKQPKQETLL
jgi:DNA modification methylase